ncbi:TonB-dependent receptor [Parabacteroides sp. OttesenSCG-928-G06]|nr:TonB-dependent receptor [Parabacteroides sp. OttesenSCG-928-K15]MDL2281866.1 TonB-dependent receptor [Parabacteroides sp. OttesenSCG-928-G06]
MKLTFIACFLFAAGVFATDVASQVAKVTLSHASSPFREVLWNIEEQTDYLFVYDRSEIDLNQSVTISAQDKPVAEVLSLLFQNSDMVYAMEGNNIMLMKSEAIGSMRASQQTGKRITGKILDQAGEPVIGANVSVKGTATGTITNYDGEFDFNVPEGAVLLVTYIGYVSQEIRVGNQTNIRITLLEDTQALEEVVVVGYGVQKKVNVTGSVAAVGAEAIQGRPVTSATSALQGLLAGVTVIQNSGQPGAESSKIRIRGTGTLNNSNPMYVVDGLVVNSIDDIDPSDIENVSVLKDAASAAIYGARAANGVVLVTTKKGTKAAPRLKYEGYVGWQTPTALQEYLPSWEYAELYNKALAYESKTPVYSAEDIQKFKAGTDLDNYPNTDWLDLLYQGSGFQQNHRAEISGGSETTTYMLSLGYMGQDGVVEKVSNERYTLRLNLNTKVNKFAAGANISYTYNDRKEPTNPFSSGLYQIFRQAYRIAPWVPYKTSNGYYGYINDGNPIAWLDESAPHKFQTRTMRGIGNVSYEIIPGLKIQEILGYEYRAYSDEHFIKDIQFYNWKTGQPTNYQGPNSLSEQRQDYQNVTLQTLLTYNNTFGKHTVSALAGYSQEYGRRDWSTAGRKSFLNNELQELDAGSADTQTNNGSATEYAMQSFFGRVTYDYDNRYLFEANIRHDGTSRIAKEHRWGTFPSFSAAWRVINESFMEGTRDILSDLKVRAGWGLLGNQQLGTSGTESIQFYPYQSVLASRNYVFGGKINTGVGPVDGANTALKWETSESMNLAVDMGFLNNKYTLSIDIYSRETRDILMKLPVSTLYGLNAPYQNAGKVSNKGVEFQAGYKLLNRDWSFSAIANAAYNKNEILDLQNDGAKIWNGYSFQQEGYPINSFGGYEVLGIFQTQAEVDGYAVVNRNRAGPGDLKYKDQNNDGKIDGEDRVYLGSWDPKWIFGLTLSGTWKGFDASVFFQGAAGVKGYAQTEMIGELGGSTSKPTTVFRDSWDAETNPNGKFPRPLSSWSQNFSSLPSDFWIIDASYLRLKNVQVGYTLPKALTEKVFIEKLRVYYSGQNLLTFSAFEKGFDPEAPAGVRAYYPQVKTHTFGLSVTF